MTEDNLLPCPFCGSAPHTEQHEHPYSAGQNYWTVLCSKCGAEMGGADCPAEAEAITAWNTRTPSPAFEALEDALGARLHVRLPSQGSGVPKKLALERRDYHRIVLEELRAILSRTKGDAK